MPIETTAEVPPPQPPPTMKEIRDAIQTLDFGESFAVPHKLWQPTCREFRKLNVTYASQREGDNIRFWKVTHEQWLKLHRKRTGQKVD